MGTRALCTCGEEKKMDSEASGQKWQKMGKKEKITRIPRGVATGAESWVKGERAKEACESVRRCRCTLWCAACLFRWVRLSGFWTCGALNPSLETLLAETYPQKIAFSGCVKNGSHGAGRELCRLCVAMAKEAQPGKMRVQ